MKQKKYKAWVLTHKGKPIYYYAMWFALPTKAQAKREIDYYNSPPLNHDYKIQNAVITLII